MEYFSEDIESLDRISRLKIINSITGIKPANLIGTISNTGVSNLAIFSSVLHLGSNPSLLGFIARPRTKQVGHTLENIQQSTVYTINHILPQFIKKAHYTSAKFPRDTSEFEYCGLNEEYIQDIVAPFVRESNIKIGMRFRQSIPIPLNGTTLVIGEVIYLQIPNSVLDKGDINLEKANSVGISGLNSYYSFQKIAEFPYVRID